MTRSADVDEWFASYENPMKAVVERVREIVLGADPRIEECIKWQAPTFMYRGNLASFFPKSKQHASLMFHLGALIPGDHPRLEGGGDTSRIMKVGSIDEADEVKRDLERVVKAWCKWRDAEEVAAKRPEAQKTIAPVVKTLTTAAPTKKPKSPRKVKAKPPSSPAVTTTRAVRPTSASSSSSTGNAKSKRDKPKRVVA